MARKLKGPLHCPLVSIRISFLGKKLSLLPDCQSNRCSVTVTDRAVLIKNYLDSSTLSIYCIENWLCERIFSLPQPDERGKKEEEDTVGIYRRHSTMIEVHEIASSSFRFLLFPPQKEIRLMKRLALLWYIVPIIHMANTIGVLHIWCLHASINDFRQDRCQEISKICRQTS